MRAKGQLLPPQPLSGEDSGSQGDMVSAGVYGEDGVASTGSGDFSAPQPLGIPCKENPGAREDESPEQGTEGPRHFLLASLSLCLWKSKALVPVAATLWTQHLSAGV